MSKRFRACDLNQPFLLPPSLQDWLPEGHLARFAGEIVDGLDLSAIYATYQRKDGRGLAAYHPLLLVRLLFYGYCVGVASSRQIERRTHDDVAFRYLAAGQHPDHDTIASFRQTHLSDLAGLFLQALQLCEKAGLVKLGHVAIDGTKLQANASKHKAMSYERMTEKEQALKAEVEQLLAEAARVDAAEDAQYGKGKRGDELPAELARRESRLRKIAQAKAALEQEARERALAEPSVAEAMRRKLSSPEGKAVYKMRKAVVEPVFGQIKERRGFRRFLFRGLKKVEAERQIICLTHNLLKLFRAGVCPPALGTA